MLASVSWTLLAFFLRKFLFSWLQSQLGNKNGFLQISYLCTYDLYGPECNVFDACRSITRASGWGLGPGNRDFFGLYEMASSRLACAISSLHWISISLFVLKVSAAPARIREAQKHMDSTDPDTDSLNFDKSSCSKSKCCTCCPCRESPRSPPCGCRPSPWSSSATYTWSPSSPGDKKTWGSENWQGGKRWVLTQGFGSDSALDPGIQTGQWIRIRIRIPDPGGQNDPLK